MKRMPLTLKGAERLRNELKRLKSEERPRVIQASAVGTSRLGSSVAWSRKRTYQRRWQGRGASRPLRPRPLRRRPWARWGSSLPVAGSSRRKHRRKGALPGWLR